MSRKYRRRNGWRTLARSEGGSIAILAALCLTVVLGFVGLGVDVGKMLELQRRGQASLDAAVLAASNALVPDEKRQSVFDASFAKNFGDDTSSILKIEFQHSGSSGGSGALSLQYVPTIMRALGQSSKTFDLVSKANVEDGVDLEIVFVLDISGSMNATDMGGGSRLAALKSSVNLLIDTVLANKASSQKIRFGIVPFNMAVNVGTDNEAIVENTRHALFSGTEWAGCVLERRGGYHAKGVYNAGATDGSGKWPAYIWPPEPNSTRSCLNPSNGTNARYASVEPAPLGRNPWKMGPNFNCPRYPITRLTTSESSTRSAIGDLVAYGNMGTTVGPAVGWALRMLSPDGPFQDAAGFSKSTRKIMIVVTDGEMVTDGSSCSGTTNTAAPYKFDPAAIGLQGRTLTSAPVDDSFTPYGYLVDSDPFDQGVTSRSAADRELDRLSVEACSEAKTASAGGIEIYTIAASRGAGPTTRAFSVLSKCASKPENFLYAEDASKLDDAFRLIAKKAINLRLTQ
ncbi:MAG: pilus assembly protein TadG-related protein [Hyphomicrobiaceae bacterium]